MKRIITTMAVAILFGFASNAQDIAGFDIWSHPTRAQIEKKFGKPISYTADDTYVYVSDDKYGRDVKGICEIYEYPGMRIEITTDCGIEYFEIYSREYPVFTNRVSAAGVRVGDKASILETKYHLACEKCKSGTEYSRKIGADWYEYFYPNCRSDVNFFTVLVKDGIIYGFEYNVVKF